MGRALGGTYRRDVILFIVQDGWDWLRNHVSQCSTKCFTFHTYTFLQRRLAAKRCHQWKRRFWLVELMLCMLHQQCLCVNGPMRLGLWLVGENAVCMSHQRRLNFSASDWSTTTQSVCPTKWWVFEKGRTPTSDCQGVFIGVSPIKYDNFLLGIVLFLVHVASFWHCRSPFWHWNIKMKIVSYYMKKKQIPDWATEFTKLYQCFWYCSQRIYWIVNAFDHWNYPVNHFVFVQWN